MNLKFLSKLIIFQMIINNSFSLIVYFKFQISCADDYLDSIISSEGIVEPINPAHTFHSERDYHYIYYFNDIKHNLEKEICVQLIDKCIWGFFAFVNVQINEYDITILNYENYYHCNNCNLETKNKFRISDNLCLGSPIIETYEGDHCDDEIPNTFCLNPTNDISIFYSGERKINQNYYKGNIIEYTLNNEIDNFNIDNLFIINGNEDYIFDLNTVSLKIINISNKKGNLYNGNEELFNNSFFNAKNNFLTHKNIKNESYTMIITFLTKPRKQNILISTCEKEAKIILYVSSYKSAINYCKINDDIKVAKAWKNKSNFHVLKCYELNFSSIGQANNFISYFFIIIFVFNIFLIIITQIFLNSNIDNLIKYCKDYIDNNNNDNQKFNNLREIYLNKEKSNEIIQEYCKDLNNFINEKILNSPPKRHTIKNINNSKKINIMDINNSFKNKKVNNDKMNNSMEIKNNIVELLKNDNTKDPSNNDSKHSSQVENKKKINQRSIKNNIDFEKNNKNEEEDYHIDKREEYKISNNYYIYIIYSYDIKERGKFLIEGELNSLEYTYYRNIEKRKWYEIFWSIFKINYDFTNTFFIYNNNGYKDFKLYAIKIMIYINSILISIIVNIMFYTEETIKDIYEEKGKYNILNRLLIILLADTVMKIMPIIFEILVDYQDKFIELKINLNESNKKIIKTEINKIVDSTENNNELTLGINKIRENSNQNINTENRFITDKNINNNENYKDIIGQKIKKSFKRNIIIFYIIIILLNLFSWYYASCFCAVYKKAQKFLLLDYALGILLSLISCLLSSFFYLIYKIVIIKGKYSNVKKYIFKVINTDFLFFIIEKILELIIVLLIKI